MSKIEKFITTTCEITLNPDQVEHIIKQFLKNSGAIPDKSYVTMTTDGVGLEQFNGIRVKTVQNDSTLYELELK